MSRQPLHVEKVRRVGLLCSWQIDWTDMATSAVGANAKCRNVRSCAAIGVTADSSGTSQNRCERPKGVIRSTIAAVDAAFGADERRRRPTSGVRRATAQAQCRLGGAQRMQYGGTRWQPWRRGPLRLGQGLLLCRGPLGSRLALAGQIGRSGKARHRSFPHACKRSKPRPRRGLSPLNPLVDR
jgi:hypothetical protein